jgi:hypothetical protein
MVQGFGTRTKIYAFPDTYRNWKWQGIERRQLCTVLLCRLHTAFLHWPLSSAATKEVQGPDTTWRKIQRPLPWSWRESMGKRYLVTQGRWWGFWEAPAPLSLPPPPGQPGQNTLPPPFRGHTPPSAWVPLEASLGENTLRPRVQDQRPWDGQEEDEETIVSFSAAF